MLDNQRCRYAPLWLSNTGPDCDKYYDDQVDPDNPPFANYDHRVCVVMNYNHCDGRATGHSDGVPGNVPAIQKGC